MELCRKRIAYLARLILALLQVFVVFAIIINMAAYQMLASMAKASHGPGGELEDAGTDINDSWIAE